MKIEAGKYYRMRCGGAVKIEQEIANVPYPFHAENGCWTKEGKSVASSESMFDLVSEITEAEYNAIVGGASDIRTYLAMQAEIESLEGRLEIAEEIGKNWKAQFTSSILHFRRELAGKVLIHCLESEKHSSSQGYAESAVKKVNALIKALEVKE